MSALGIAIVGAMLTVGFSLFYPQTMKLALVGSGLILVVGVIKTLTDKQDEKIQTRERNEEEEMKNLPAKYDSGGCGPLSPYYGSSYGSPIIFTPNPENTIAKLDPSLAAKVLKKQSGDDVLRSAMNSSVATEFARQHRGTRGGVRVSRNWLTGTETTEFFIKPTDD